MTRREEIAVIARRHGWQKPKRQPNGDMMMTFVKGKQKIEVWPSRMTVATMLRHPKQGKTKLYRRSVSLDVMEAIFDNPRVHTTGGYKRGRKSTRRTTLV